MNGIYNPIIFYITAIMIIFFAVLSIQLKNILYSLLSAIVVFFLAGILFYILGSEYNAVIQLAIYGVAVPVLLGLAIMFTNFKKENKEINKKSFWLNILTILTGGIFVLAVIYLVLTSNLISPESFSLNYRPNTSVQVMNAFSQGLFVQYVWAFELVSLILTIIVAGMTIFMTRRDK